jgi:hypothetical protein
MALAMRRGRPLAPPPRARRSPGAAITFGRRCCYEVWQSGVDGPRVEGVRLCWGARAPPPPLCARRSPGGAVITYVRRRGEAAEAVSMSPSRLDGQRWRSGAGGPSPPG